MKSWWREELVTRRVAAISSNLYKQSNAVLKGALNETNYSNDVGSCDSFPKQILRFESKFVFHVLNHFH